jgi:hypothetical protein
VLPWLTEVAGVLAAATDKMDNEEEEVVEVLGEDGRTT